MAVTGILGKKIGMTQVFDDKGDVHPITVLQAGPCVITQLKTLAKDGYDAAQIGLVEFVKSSKVNKPMAGHFAKSNVPPVKLMREVAFEVAARRGGRRDSGRGQGRRQGSGRHLLEEKYVDVIGTSKGRGFCRRRSPPSLRRRPEGARTHVPGAGLDRCIVVSFARVSRAAHAGSLWVDRVTVRNLRIRGIDLDENLLMVEGAVPGPRDGYVLISKSKAPPRERRGFGGAGTSRSVEGFEEGFSQEEVRTSRVRAIAPCRRRTGKAWN